MHCIECIKWKSLIDTQFLFQFEVYSYNLKYIDSLKVLEISGYFACCKICEPMLKSFLILWMSSWSSSVAERVDTWDSLGQSFLELVVRGSVINRAYNVQFIFNHYSLSHSLAPNIQNIITLKLFQPEILTQCSPYHVFHVTHVKCDVSHVRCQGLHPPICHLSHVTCQVGLFTCHVSHYTSHVSCNFFSFFFIIFSSSFYKGVKLAGGGSVINKAQPSSFKKYRFLVKSRGYYTNPVFCVVNVSICYKTNHIFSCFDALSYPKVYIKSNKKKPLRGKLSFNKAPPVPLFLNFFFYILEQLNDTYICVKM